MGLDYRRINYVRQLGIDIRSQVLYEFLKNGTSMREIERKLLTESNGWNAWSVIHYYGFDKSYKHRYPKLCLSSMIDQVVALDDKDLGDWHLSDYNPDLPKIQYNTRLSEDDGTDVFATMKARKGQHKLRKMLLVNYRQRCALCSINDARLLVTSHIKPWADSSKEERVDPTNAILLCKLHDALFENGYISISDSYEVVYSSYEKFIEQGIATNLVFCKPVQDIPGQPYLEYHRTKHQLQ